MSNNGKALARAAEAAGAKVQALEARRADRQNEHARLAADVAELGGQIALADAAGQPTAMLEADRERRLQRQRDLAAVLPVLEQQLAEARAAKHAAEGQLVTSEREAARHAVVRGGRALDATVRALVEATTEQRAALQQQLAELARLDERADHFAGRRHLRGPQSVYEVARELPLLLNYLMVLGKWSAGLPALVGVEVAAQPAATGSGDVIADRLARVAGVR